MNPIYDLFVIGAVILMVWINLYYSRPQTKQMSSMFSTFKERLTAVNVFNVYKANSSLSHHASTPFSLK
ncbi:MAG: hypothetical protein NPIRA05_06710 [Nitrospirales bacterium]|nr:MAG: hypothetical protein NPIRA05_06710 [Nitrospirales bacterium]